MPSYTDEQKRRAVDMVEECGGSVTCAMRDIGVMPRMRCEDGPNRNAPRSPRHICHCPGVNNLLTRNSQSER